MPTFVFELHGTITRDIIRREGEFLNVEEARDAAAKEYPLYRLHSVVAVDCKTCNGTKAIWSGPYHDGRGERAGKMIPCPNCGETK